MRAVPWAVTAALVTLLSACAGGPDAPPPPEARTSTAAPEATDKNAPTGWGPTVGEVEKAGRIVSRWSDEQLAGGVIVGRFHGYDPEEPSDMVRDLHLAGVSVTSGNVSDRDQVVAMTEAIAQAARDDGRTVAPIIGVDQEGGYVSHLAGIATEFPSFQYAGLAIAQDRKTGGRVTREAARWTAMELRSLGFTWVFAPVADVTIGSADPTIGPRSPSDDPSIAAVAASAAVKGYNVAGVVSTTKHFPGHGSATSDSHDTLPALDSTLAEMNARDLPPFRKAIASGAPSIMMSHLDLTQIAPGVPASMAPEVYELLREDLGFEGVAITDSLGMGAVGGRPKPAVQALAAGADLLLMPVDTATTHRLVTEAIASGEVPRERVIEAATRVLALQMWQERIAGQRPVPEDVTERAELASDELTSAAY